MKTSKLFLLFLTGTALVLSGCGNDNDKVIEKPSFSITVTNNGLGTASAMVGSTAASTAKQGTTVTLTATPKEGYVFDRWTIESGGITLSPDATSNPATFTMPAAAVNVKAEFVEINGVMINGIVWAKCNVDAPHTFAAKPEDYGMFYQWNRKKAWPATGEVTDWDTTIPSGDSWDPANDPCPKGWRLPTKEEQATLLAVDKVSNEVVVLNGVDCRKFTDKTSGETIFLPFARLRNSNNGSLEFTGNLKGGFYWTSSLFSEGHGWGLNFVRDNIAQYNSVGTYGFTVRCILK